MNAEAWHIWHQLKAYCLMSHISGQKLAEAMARYLEYQSVLSYISKSDTQDLGHNLLNQYTHFLLKESAHGHPISQGIKQMAQYSRKLLAQMSQYISFSQNYHWVHFIPKSYRFTQLTFFNRWVYASDILEQWARDDDQITYYWALLQMQNATYEDLPDLYDCAMRAKRRLVKKQQEWIGQSYFWQYKVRQLLRQSSSYYGDFEKKISLALRKKYTPNRHAHAFGSLMLQSQHTPPVLQFIFSKIDIATMQLCWKMHYSANNMMDIQQKEKESVLFDYCQYGIQAARHQPYRYQKVIDTLLREYPKMPPKRLGDIFKQTAANRIDFWLQFANYTVGVAKPYNLAISGYVSQWCIHKERIQSSQINDIELTRVHPEDMVYLATKYNTTLKKDQVGFVLRRLEQLDYQYFSKITWDAYKLVYTLWYSINMIMIMRYPLEENYKDKIELGFRLQQSLPLLLKQNLESYMVVLAGYIWPSVMPDASMKPLLTSCQTVGGKVWKRGIEKMLVGQLHRGQNKRRDNDR